METLLLLLSLLACLHPTWAFCPRECVCDDFSLEASCIKSNLEVNIKSIREKYSLDQDQVQAGQNICFQYEIAILFVVQE